MLLLLEVLVLVLGRLGLSCLEHIGREHRRRSSQPISKTRHPDFAAVTHRPPQVQSRCSSSAGPRRRACSSVSLCLSRRTRSLLLSFAGALPLCTILFRSPRTITCASSTTLYASSNHGRRYSPGMLFRLVRTTGFVSQPSHHIILIIQRTDEERGCHDGRRLMQVEQWAASAWQKRGQGACRRRSRPRLCRCVGRAAEKGELLPGGLVFGCVVDSARACFLPSSSSSSPSPPSIALLARRPQQLAPRWPQYPPQQLRHQRLREPAVCSSERARRENCPRLRPRPQTRTPTASPTTSQSSLPSPRQQQQQQQQ